MKLVENWKSAWKWYSVHIMVVIVALPEILELLSTGVQGFTASTRSCWTNNFPGNLSYSCSSGFSGEVQ